MISQTAEYALRAVVCLADHPDGPLTTQQLARTTNVPADYLSKVLQALGRAGLVKSQRGLGGGFTLTRAPETLTALEVVNIVDPLKRIEQCPRNVDVHFPNLCPLHRRLDDAVAKLEKELGDCMIAELLTNSHANGPLCEDPDDRNPATERMRDSS